MTWEHRRLCAFQRKTAAVIEVATLMVCQQLDDARPQPTGRVQGFGPASLQFALPFLTGARIHLPAMSFANDRGEKPGHLYRFLARQSLDFDLAILRHELAYEHGFSVQLRREHSVAEIRRQVT